ncbi:MAG: methionine--tRNA ligase [Pseudomonadota bacterium]|nr:methionine--tRNA ligase [Pseudomonadota bacterium]
MTDRQNYYVTTPIYYVNDVPHIGHAYTSIACDAAARFQRLDGRDVMFLTGTDEHGQKVAKNAASRGMDPQSFTDEISQSFRNLTDLLNFTNDDFIRTTEERHKRAVSELWNRLVTAGDIYLDSYAGWYAVRDEAYYAEGELTDGPEGKKIAPTGAECEWVEEPSYFFRLSAWQDRLLDFYAAHPDFVLPKSRMNEVTSFVKSGLRDLSISRTTFDWGVPVPGAPDHVMYVWLDALTNYISGLGFPDVGEESLFARFWPASAHVVGKDILRFHAVYWPAFLMAASVEPPQHVIAHGWWTIEGEKMSKSLGNVVLPQDLVESFGVDQTRYFLLREVPFGNDGDFSREAMVHRINGDLANALGNLVQRVLSMIHKNCNAAIPDHGTMTGMDRALLDAAAGLLVQLRPEMEQMSFHKALDLIWNVVADANRYVDEQAPWALRKTDPARMNTVLWTLAETIRRLAILIQPFMPDSAARILNQLAVPARARGFDALDDGTLIAFTPIDKPQGVFPRLDMSEAT